MATSISKSVNYKQAAAAPDYQVAARPVDTFVQGERNTKGMQVAAALEQASGAVARYGQVQASKKEQQITNLELLRASNYASEFEASVKEFAETYDYGIVDGARPSSDEVWAAYTSSNPEYQDALSKLTTDAGRNALNKSIGNVFYSTYGGASKAFESSEEDVELGNYASKELAKVDLSADDPKFFDVFKNIDNSIQSMDRSPQQAKQLLMDAALRAANENEDFRLYSLLLGEVEGRPTILSDTEYKIAFNQRGAVESRLRAKKNRLDNEKADAVKAAQVTLRTAIGNLFVNKDATQENILAVVQTAEEAGLSTAASDADKILKAYKSISTEEIDPEERIRLHQAYQEAPDKMEWLSANAKFLNESMLNTFLSQAPRTSPYNETPYKNGIEVMKSIVKDPDALFFSSLPQYATLIPMFEEEFQSLSSSAEWTSMSTTQQNDAVFAIINKLQGYKANIPDPEDTGRIASPSEVRMLNTPQKLPPNAKAIQMWKQASKNGTEQPNAKFMEDWNSYEGVGLIIPDAPMLEGSTPPPPPEQESEEVITRFFSPEDVESIQDEVISLTNTFLEGEPKRDDFRQTPTGSREYKKAKADFDRLEDLRDQLKQADEQGFAPYFENLLSRYDDNSKFNIEGDKIIGSEMRKAHKEELKQIREQLEQLRAQSK
tara:strand:- start:14801 stop:16789 length:1989 start_codon:yes stop_codon:yes gene_type:complete